MAAAFAPETNAGRQLLAHEVTDVLQQSESGSRSEVLQRAPDTAAAAASSTTEAADTTCKGSADKHTETNVYAGKFPPEVTATFGEVFNPIQRALDTQDRLLGIHFPILNRKGLPLEAPDIAQLINGPEKSGRAGVKIEREGRRCRAFFSPATPNLAASSIVLPATSGSGSTWTLNDAEAYKVANLISTISNEGKTPIDYRGSDEDCRNRTDPVKVVYSFSTSPAAIIEAHETRHAEDWKKTFCRVIGRRDRRITKRTGKENARTGFALRDPAKAEERALRKLYRGVESKLETAKELVESIEQGKKSLHRAGKLNFQNERVTVTEQCSGVSDQNRDSACARSGAGRFGERHRSSIFRMNPRPFAMKSAGLSEPASSSSVRFASGRRLQRKCACGGTPGPSGECESCRQKRLAAERGPAKLQTKLVVTEAGNAFEREADRAADSLVSGASIAPLSSFPGDSVGKGPPPIVDEVVASGGQPLDDRDAPPDVGTVWSSLWAGADSCGCARRRKRAGRQCSRLHGRRPHRL